MYSNQFYIRQSKFHPEGKCRSHAATNCVKLFEFATRFHGREKRHAKINCWLIWGIHSTLSQSNGHLKQCRCPIFWPTFGKFCIFCFPYPKEKYHADNDYLSVPFEKDTVNVLFTSETAKSLMVQKSCALQESRMWSMSNVASYCLGRVSNIGNICLFIGVVLP